MKKLYEIFYNFLFNHDRIGRIICTIMLFASATSILDHIIFFAEVCFGFSIASLFRLITYRYGKIPFFMKDTTWKHYRRKYKGDELDERYEKMSIERATIYFMLALISFFLWVITEIVILIFA